MDRLEQASAAISEGGGQAENFALRLKLKRIKAGLRQFDVSRKTGIPEWRLTKLETARALPKGQEIEKLRAVLGEL